LGAKKYGETSGIDERKLKKKDLPKKDI